MKTPYNYKFINTDYLYSVSENNDFIKKIFYLFKEQVQTFKKELPEFLNTKNYEDLAELIHKAKSSISIFGMTKQADSLKLLEKDIRNSLNPETYEDRIFDFITDCNSAVSEIKILENTLS